MSDQQLDMKDLSYRMQRSLEILMEEFGGLRTGRASVSLLEPLMVDAYGSQMPMNQIGTVSIPEPRMVSVQVWDKELVGAVEKSIRESSLGLNPMVEGTLLRVPIPELTQERRGDLFKVAGQYAERTRIAVRNIRRDGMEQLKKMEKDSVIGKDEYRDRTGEVQKLTDDMISRIDEALTAKEEEIMQV